MKEYYLKDRNRIKGPFMLDDLKYQRIKSNTLVKIDDGEWIPVSEESDLSFLLKVSSGYEITEHNERQEKPENVKSKSSKMILIVSILILLMGIGISVFIFLGLGIR